jgi:HEAT repeat protein
VLVVGLFLLINCLGLGGWLIRVMIAGARAPAAEGPPKTDADFVKAVAALDSGDAGRRRAVAGLLARSDTSTPRRPEVAAALARQLADTDPRVRESAASALVVWATPADAADLAAALADPADAVRGTAARALVGLGSEAEPAVIPLLFREDNKAQQEAARVLSKLATAPETIAPFAVQALAETEPARRKAAAEWLAKARAAESVRPQVSQALGPLSRDPDFGVAVAACKALSVWGTADNVPDLLRVLEHPDANVRKSAVAALGAIRDPRAVAALGEKLNNAFEWQAAFAAIQAIGDRARPEVVKLQSHPDARIREKAGQLLRLLGGDAGPKTRPGPGGR